MRHAETEALLETRIGGIGESAVAVVRVEVEPGEVGGNDEIEVIILIEVDESSAESTAIAFFSKARSRSDVGKISVPIVAEQ